MKSIILKLTSDMKADDDDDDRKKNIHANK